jgi:hypothetical protein
MPDDEPEGHTFRLSQIIPGKAWAPNDGEPTAAAAQAQGFPEGPQTAGLQAAESRNQQKQLKTAAQLAEMIELDLAHHPDCPKAGLRVTVYGWPRWRAMLTILPAAGGVQNPQEWRELTQELAERLRKHYDLAWEE